MVNIIEQTLCFLLYAVVVADIVFVNRKPLIPVVRKADRTYCIVAFKGDRSFLSGMLYMAALYIAFALVKELI